MCVYLKYQHKSVCKTLSMVCITCTTKKKREKSNTTTANNNTNIKQIKQ